MRFVLLAFLLLTTGCEAVVSFDRSKIDGGAKALPLVGDDLDAGLPEAAEGVDSGVR